MPWKRWLKRAYRLMNPGRRSGRKGFANARGQRTHVIIMDGTMSSLEPGLESNAGLTFNLLSDLNDPALSLYYEAGLQWQDWRATRDVITGRGINRQIRRAYGYLASRYKPGDRIILLGYSRGAYAVRSLAGVIDQVGLLRASDATERNVATAYRHYQADKPGPVAQDFAAAHCHASVEIEMVGVWDTVKSLGLPMPVFWRLTEPAHAFHNHELGGTIRHGYHALALNETRVVYSPILWSAPPSHEGHVEQVWFRGNHADIGGYLKGFEATRPLSNIPLVWMLENVERHGVTLPNGWQALFPMDAGAPSSSNWQGWTKLFVSRRRRVVGQDRSERLHESVPLEEVERSRLSWPGMANTAR